MLEARTIGIAVAREWRDLYEAIWRPEAFPRWASGLARSTLVEDGEWWSAQGPEGRVRIRFTAWNAFGILDHWVDVGAGPPVSVPLRIVANGEGAQVLLTLFRQPGMTDEHLARDEAWVRRDLAALKALAEG